MGSANTLTEDPDIRISEPKTSDPYYPDIRIICIIRISVLSGYSNLKHRIRWIRIIRISVLSGYSNLKYRIRWIRIIRISGYAHYPNPNLGTNQRHRLKSTSIGTYDPVDSLAHHGTDGTRWFENIFFKYLASSR